LTAHLVRLLQLASPMLPIGAFSYSGGLEAAIESGAVYDAASGARWIGDVLHGSVGRQDAVLVALTQTDWRALVEYPERAPDAALVERMTARNTMAFATRETAELRQESTQSGHSLAIWIERTLDPGNPLQSVMQTLAPLAYPLAWAAAGAQLGLAARETVVALLWSFAENQASALMKALPLGQTPAQRMLLELGATLDALADDALERARTAAMMPMSASTLADNSFKSVEAVAPDAHWLGGAMPALAIASMQHETQYSRLFRS